MINFNDPKDKAPLAMAGIGVLFILASIVAPFVFPKMNSATLTRKFHKDEGDLKDRSEKAKSDKETFEAFIGKYRWEEKEDFVAPKALSLITKSAESSQLKLISFRPQKSLENSDLVVIPMQFTVDGSFANVANMVERLQTGNTRLAVQQVQYASQEGETDQVSATVSLFAFGKKPEVKKSSSKAEPIETKNPGVNRNG